MRHPEILLRSALFCTPALRHRRPQHLLPPQLRPRQFRPQPQRSPRLQRLRWRLQRPRPRSQLHRHPPRSQPQRRRHRSRPHRQLRRPRLLHVLFRLSIFEVQRSGLPMSADRETLSRPRQWQPSRWRSPRFALILPCRPWQTIRHASASRSLNPNSESVPMQQGQQGERRSCIQIL